MIRKILEDNKEYEMSSISRAKQREKDKAKEKNKKKGKRSKRGRSKDVD